ncbi:MAG: hypothetical protein ACK4IY_04160, partial [Chitinophagales bacterium]
TFNKARIAPDPYAPVMADEYNMLIEPVFAPFIGPLYWDATYSVPYYHHFTINTGDYNDNRYYFIRFYIQDADHSEPTEIPNDGTPFYLLTYYAFKVE